MKLQHTMKGKHEILKSSRSIKRRSLIENQEQKN